MKKIFLGILSGFFFNIPIVTAQLPPGQMYGQCSTVYGPVYNSSNKAYSASGSCQSGARVSCATDPMDGTPDYYCQSNGNNGQDTNPSMAADEACGCIDN